ncbi:hypothetical protein NKH55_30620 [Mesorhizobium opportunistum]|uniref:hypothetical protein n=1 Tax=Mesorhizobium opportunistum TaxID=593909 RepID=UPI00333BAD2B
MWRLAQPTGALRVGIARTKWGEIDLDAEVPRALEATASLLGDDNARAMARAIDSSTLAPVNLKHYEYGRAEQIDPRELHEALRKKRFQVGEAIRCLDIRLTPTMPYVATPHRDSYCTTNATLSVEEFNKAARRSNSEHASRPCQPAAMPQQNLHQS